MTKKDEIIELLRDPTLTYDEIGTKKKVSKQYVSQIAKENNLQRRAVNKRSGEAIADIYSAQDTQRPIYNATAIGQRAIAITEQIQFLVNLVQKQYKNNQLNDAIRFNLATVQELLNYIQMTALHEDDKQNVL